MNVEEVLERVDKEFRRAIRQPEDFEFSERNPYKVVISEPEQYGMERAVVDLENQNVKVRYQNQATRENHVCVKHDPITDIALVESNTNHQYNGKFVNSTGYYLVQGEETLWKTNSGWEDTLQTRPSELAKNFEELYRQAINIDNQHQTMQTTNEETGDKNLEPVPPPEDEF